MVWDDCFSMPPKHVCIKCRHVGNSECHKHDDNIIKHWRWRGPKKNNLLAWRRIANGEWLWDRKAVAKAARKRADKQELMRQRIKKKKKERLNGYYDE